MPSLENVGKGGESAKGCIVLSGTSIFAELDNAGSDLHSFILSSCAHHSCFLSLLAIVPGIVLEEREKELLNATEIFFKNSL